jgi:hypothetical protein
MCLHEFEFYSLDMIVLLPHSVLSAGRGMLHVIEWQRLLRLPPATSACSSREPPS